VDLRTLLKILVRRWIVVVPTIVVAVLVGQQMLSSVKPEYQAKGSMILLAPVTKAPVNGAEPIGIQSPNPVLDIPATLDKSALALAEILNDEPQKATIKKQGLSDDFEVTVNKDAPILEITATSDRRPVAVETARAVLDMAKAQLAIREAQFGVGRDAHINTSVLSTPAKAATVNAAKTRALVALIALGIAATLSVALLVESWAQSPARRERRRGRRGAPPELAGVGDHVVVPVDPRGERTVSATNASEARNGKAVAVASGKPAGRARAKPRGRSGAAQ
jgi:capsular polysaccharide biosynthesis protein